MHTTPVSLLQRLRLPTAEQAWRRFVQLYSPLLYHWARSLGCQEADAADLVQDVFIVLVRKLPHFQYDRQQSFRAWLRTILLNRWRDRQRSLVTRLTRTGDVALADLLAPESDELFSESAYRRHVLGRALELLQPEFQPTTWRAFQEHGMAGRPAAEVAAELGLSTGAVYAAKFRVLTRLREELQDLLD